MCFIVKAVAILAHSIELTPMAEVVG